MSSTTMDPVESPTAPTLAESTPTVADGPSISTEAASTEPMPLSKNATKKAARDARFAAQKGERRAKEKEMKKMKKRARAEKLASGEIDEDEEEKLRAAKRAKVHTGPKTPFNARVVFDLGFDDMMSEREVSSLCSQLAYAYSANRHSGSPIESMLFTSLDKRTFTRLESMSDAGYKRWNGTEWWSEGYDRLWSAEAPSEVSVPVVEGETAESQPTASGSKTGQETVIYLTADADDEITELKEGETYIIGGICDHNRHKNLCLNKANDSKIRAARLPIGTYLASMPTRKVLTVNQVFEILLRWVETRDWEQAMMAVMPKRKFTVKGGGGGPQDDGGDKQDAEDATSENVYVYREEDLVQEEAP